MFIPEETIKNISVSVSVSVSKNKLSWLNWQLKNNIPAHVLAIPMQCYTCTRKEISLVSSPGYQLLNPLVKGANNLLSYVFLVVQFTGHLLHTHLFCVDN